MSPIIVAKIQPDGLQLIWIYKKIQSLWTSCNAELQPPPRRRHFRCPSFHSITTSPSPNLNAVPIYGCLPIYRRSQRPFRRAFGGCGESPNPETAHAAHRPRSPPQPPSSARSQNVLPTSAISTRLRGERRVSLTTNACRFARQSHKRGATTVSRLEAGSRSRLGPLLSSIPAFSAPSSHSPVAFVLPLSWPVWANRGPPVAPPTRPSHRHGYVPDLPR